MDTLTTPWGPGLDSEESITVRMLSNHFVGDAMHDIADGINVAPSTYTAVWVLYDTGADALLAFLRGHRGQVFLWQTPEDTAPRKWEATKWTRTAEEADRDKVSVTLEERFV